VKANVSSRFRKRANLTLVGLRWTIAVVTAIASATLGQKPQASDAAVSTSSSDSTDAEKAYEMGFKYYRGGGDVLIDHRKAFKEFTRAADLGLPEAQARLAELLGERFFLDFLWAPDPAAAAVWARKALARGLEAKAEARKHRAEYELASLCVYGRALPRNYEKAAQLFERAADHGDSDAKRALGFLYLAGLGVTKNCRRAESYFQEAAADRNATAQLWLGIIYHDGGEGVPKSQSKAAEMFQKAADQGLTTAYEQLGKCYEKGEGVPQSFTRAAELYRKGADLGNWSAQMRLGGLYERGEGVPKNLEKAVEWYRKVAEQDVKDGAEALKRLRPPASPGQE
jgi:TPR repeat protein